ncbi:MAG: hemerythrin domain-containing protein [Armatimonadetes bacterium]|nr:hemerythrin domain-containing protein [Armatimonadota bacterium]
MQATDVLRHEHEAINCVLDSLERASKALRDGKDVPAWMFTEGLDFIRTFADKCHHGKEQDRLFPLLIERGLPSDGGPVQVMLIEHDQGRAYVREAVAQCEKWVNGDKDAGLKMADALQNFIDLLREHIDKENNILYPMGDMHITQEDDQRLIRQFDEFEETQMGPGVHEKYHAMIDKLDEETANLAGGAPAACHHHHH